MPMESDQDWSARKPRMMPRAEALEKLRRHHAYVVKKRKLEKAKKGLLAVLSG